MKLKYLRWVVLSLAFVAISVGLVFNTNLGTLSSFGWQAIATICPVGVLESLLASKTIFPRALIVFAVVVVLIILFGKAFCAWICPVAPLRGFLGIIQKKLKICREKTSTTLIAKSPYSEKCDTSCGDCHDTSSGCLSCASKRAKLDSRHLLLGGSLLSAALFGFPVFCLFCPIGLIFGTVIVVWQFIGFEDISLSLLIYPLLLLVELVLLRKWCARFCPLGAFLSLLSLPNRFLRPVVNHDKCIRESGGDCFLCAEVCGEQLDPHYSDGMNECSKCGICKDKCPTGAISFTLRKH